MENMKRLKVREEGNLIQYSKGDYSKKTRGISTQRNLCSKLSNDTSKVSAVHWPDITTEGSQGILCALLYFSAYIQSSVTQTGQMLFMLDLNVLQKWGDFGKKTFHKLHRQS